MKALWASAESRKVAADLASAGFEVLILRGPPLQERLFGTPAAYMSGDVDVLVNPAERLSILEHLEQEGFRRRRRHTSLDRFALRIMTERRGFTVDLHQGIELSPYPRWSFRILERELWKGAKRGPSEFLEPRPEPLAVFLAAHAAARENSLPLRRCAIAARSLADPTEMWDLAARCRLTGAVRAATRAPSPSGRLMLDGRVGSLSSSAWSVVRGHSGPRFLTDRISEYAAYWHQGYSVVRPRRWLARVDPIQIEVWDGVCGPGTWTASLVDAWVRCSERIPRPVLVELGTGTGCLAVLCAKRRPEAAIYATDLSARAVGNARANARRHRVRVTVSRGDLFSTLPNSLRGKVDGILAHLPTIPPGSPRDEIGSGWIDRRRAPSETYEGRGGDGLDLVRALLRNAAPWLSDDASVVVSMQSWQWALFEPEAAALGYGARRIDSPSQQGAIVTLARSARTPPNHLLTR